MNIAVLFLCFLSATVIVLAYDFKDTEYSNTIEEENP